VRMCEAHENERGLCSIRAEASECAVMRDVHKQGCSRVRCVLNKASDNGRRVRASVELIEKRRRTSHRPRHKVSQDDTVGPHWRSPRQSEGCVCGLKKGDIVHRSRGRLKSGHFHHCRQGVPCRVDSDDNDGVLSVRQQPAQRSRSGLDPWVTDGSVDRDGWGAERGKIAWVVERCSVRVDS
jgi:hypothetical protein